MNKSLVLLLASIILLTACQPSKPLTVEVNGKTFSTEEASWPGEFNQPIVRSVWRDLQYHLLNVNFWIDTPGVYIETCEEGEDIRSYSGDYQIADDKFIGSGNLAIEWDNPCSSANDGNIQNRVSKWELKASWNDYIGENIYLDQLFYYSGLSLKARSMLAFTNTSTSGELLSVALYDYHREITPVDANTYKVVGSGSRFFGSATSLTAGVIEFKIVEPLLIKEDTFTLYGDVVAGKLELVGAGDKVTIIFRKGKDYITKDGTNLVEVDL